VNVVLPDFVVDSTRYTREPPAGAVNETGRVTREPSGMVRGSFPDAMTVPSGRSSHAVQWTRSALTLQMDLAGHPTP
jgi:hypothetical protein